MRTIHRNVHHLGAALAVLLALLCVAPPAHARSTSEPALFALSTSDFPKGSATFQRGVEGNRRLVRDGVLFFSRHPGRLGRLTGYYMQADVGDGKAEPYVSTAYLVSIFATVQQAENAFDLRYSSWFAAFYFTNPPAVPVPLGERGQSAWFRMNPEPRQLRSELFFRYGSVLIEVFQNADAGLPTTEQAAAVLRLATRLNARARAHPRGL